MELKLINKSKVKELINLNVSEDYYIKLNELVKSLIEESELRAQGNSRKTVFSRDL